MKRFRGFTIIELMATVLVTAILVGVAIPSMSNFLNEQSLVSDVSRFRSGLNFARSEAITRSVNVSVCPSSDGETCAAGSWSDGWIIFHDQNGNLSPDLGTKSCAAGEDCILRVGDALVSGTVIAVDAAAFGYNQQGERLAASATSVSICHPNAKRKHQMTIAASGSMSVTVKEASCP